MFLSLRRKNAYNRVHIKALRTTANNLTTIFNKRFMHDDLIIATIEGFASLAKSKDNDTGNHIERMNTQAIIAGKRLENVNKNISTNNEELYKVGIDIAMYQYEKCNGKGYLYDINKIRDTFSSEKCCSN